MKAKALHPKVVTFNKAQGQAAKQARVEVLRCLAKFYPEVFDIETRVRALQKGVLEMIWSDLAARGELPFSKSKLRQALVMFTRRMAYLACLKVGGKRYDLEGNAVEVITEAEQAHAGLMIKNRIEKSTREKIQAARNAGRSMRSMRAIGGDGRFAPPQVVVKRKVTRPPVDPEAIKRLKAKLALKKQS